MFIFFVGPGDPKPDIILCISICRSLLKYCEYDSGKEKEYVTFNKIKA